MDRGSGRVRRRTFLAGLSGSVAGLAGCSGRRGDATTTTTGTTTTTARTTSSTTTSTETTTDEPTTTTRLPPDVEPADALGVSHAGGTYSFADRNFLNEGAQVVRDLGSRTFKGYLHKPMEKYPFHSDWPDAFDSLTATVEHPYFRELFDRPFDTYVLTAYSHVHGKWGGYFTQGVTDRELERERAEFHDLTAHLLDAYRGTGKTFVLSHWEGDQYLYPDGDPAEPPSKTAIDGMIRWLGARQAGVQRARREVDSDVTVLHAPEVNHVMAAIEDGTPRMITEVVPEVDPAPDLVSYSAWEVAGEAAGDTWLPHFSGEQRYDEAAGLLRDALDFIADHAPEPGPYVESVLGDRQRPVYLGEFGWPLAERDTDRAMRLIRTFTEVSLSWGARWALYWQVYCNALQHDVSGRPGNDDVRGFYLVRPDGSKAPTWEYFSSLLDGTS